MSKADNFDRCIALVSALLVELGTPQGGERQVKFYSESGFKSVGARLRWTNPG